MTKPARFRLFLFPRSVAQSSVARHPECQEVTIPDNELSANEVLEMKFSRVVKPRERRAADRWIRAGVYSKAKCKQLL